MSLADQADTILMWSSTDCGCHALRNIGTSTSRKRSASAVTVSCIDMSHVQALSGGQRFSLLIVPVSLTNISHVQALSGGRRPSPLFGGRLARPGRAAKFEAPPVISQAVGQPPKSFPLRLCQAGRYSSPPTGRLMHIMPGLSYAAKRLHNSDVYKVLSYHNYRVSVLFWCNFYCS